MRADLGRQAPLVDRRGGLGYWYHLPKYLDERTKVGMKVDYFDDKYNDELSLVDSLFAFHPEYFCRLAPSAYQVLSEYYLFDKESPANIFEYRANLIIRDRRIEEHAGSALKQLMKVAEVATG